LTSGKWPLAAIVFFASVVVPVLKIVVLVLLAVTTQRGTDWRRLDRTRLYRMTEVIGRWSMVDVYVVTILVALVRLQALAIIEADTGAVFFAAVVVLTMFAAKSFDPRLIWDSQER
jgi:paraquat-inducible protein A